MSISKLSGFTELYHAALDVLLPELSAEEEQQRPSLEQRSEAAFTRFSKQGKRSRSNSLKLKMKQKQPSSKKPKSIPVSEKSEESYYDPIFFQQFGIKTNVLFTRIITIDPDCEEIAEKAWEMHLRQNMLEPTPEQLKTAKLFRKCINGSSETGDDPWTRKYSIKWISKEVGYGLFAKERYEKDEVIGYYAGYLTDFVTNKDYSFDFPNSPFEELHIDAGLAGNATRFINHAPDEFANVKAIEFYDNGLPFVMFVAKDPIEAGVQFFYDYGKEFWTTKGIKPTEMSS